MPEYLIRGRLAEDGQTMDFPVVESGELKPRFRAGYHVFTKFPRDYSVSDNLIYFAVPPETNLQLGEREIPIPFKQRGQIVDVRRFKASRTSLKIPSLTLVKIHPRTPFRLLMNDGASYHSFEMLEMPKSFRNPDEAHFDFIYKDEQNGLAVVERGSRVILMPGAVLYPDYCASRLPGWLAGEFNGSPEFRFSYARFEEPRPGEVLHKHSDMMEPYMCIEGVEPLFVVTEDGSERLTVKDPTCGEREYRGEIVEMRDGDVLLPLPEVPHKILFDHARYPFAHYCPNIAAKPLHEVSASDRVVLEKQ